MMPEIEKFFTSPAFAVAGASSDRSKFGNKVLRCYIEHQKTVYPVNPHEKSIEGLTCISSISELPIDVKSLSIVTPPAITESIVKDAITKKIENIWMQPGAESALAINMCHEHGINLIAGGPCLLQTLNCYF